MTIQKFSITELHKQFTIKNSKVEPSNRMVKVEGNFDRIVCNENGLFAGYLYAMQTEEAEPDKNRIRIFMPNAGRAKFDDLQFLLFKHVVITGEVTVRPDLNPDDNIDTEELQIIVKAATAHRNIRILGESTAVNKIIIKGDKHPHKRRELPPEPLKIAVISTKGSQGCNDFACIIDANAYQKLDYFYPNPFSADKIIEQIKEIVKKGTYNCLCIVRGGGPSESLVVFNDPEVIKCIKNARATMYVVTGIGHSNDSTGCDEVADYCAYTPTDAAYFLSREGLKTEK